MVEKFRMVLTLSLILASVHAPRELVAQDSQRDQVLIAVEAAEKVCQSVPVSGADQASRIFGQLNVEFPGILKRLADLGIKMEGDLSSSAYQGVLREHLAGSINAGNNCRKTVFDLVYMRIATQQVQPFDSVALRPSVPVRPSSTIWIVQASYPHNFGYFNVPDVTACVRAICAGQNACEVRGYAGPLNGLGKSEPIEVQRIGSFSEGKCELPHPNQQTKSFAIDYKCSNDPAKTHSVGVGPGWPGSQTEAGFGLPLPLSCPRT
jgi:hypothetical protein